jgi:hypothetical protein
MTIREVAWADGAHARASRRASGTTRRTPSERLLFDRVAVLGSGEEVRMDQGEDQSRE